MPKIYSSKSIEDMIMIQNVFGLGKRKRGHSKLDLPSVLAEMQAEGERNRAQRDEHIQLLLSKAREARENEAVLRREE